MSDSEALLPKADRQKIQLQKSATPNNTQPNLKQLLLGFNVPKIPPQTENSLSPQSLAHDISHISLRPQAKLTVSHPQDQYEQSAQSIANQVMNMTAPEYFPEQQNSLLSTADSNIQTHSNLENQLTATQGSGNLLPNEVQAYMEPRFGADFGNVRVHTDNTAVQMNQQLGAEAFTYGSDIYFSAGNSPGNNELTAHELTHVVQHPGESQASQTSSIGSVNNQILQRQDIDNPEQTTNQQPQQQLDLAKINADADALFKAIDGWGTDEDTILKILANKTPAEIAAIKQAYIDHYGRNLDQDLVSEMSGDDLKEAQTKLSGDKAQAAIEALNNSIGFFNDDEAKIEETLSALSPEDLKQMKQMAEKDPAVKAKLDNVLDYLGGEDKEVTEALLEGDKEKATAARIAEAIEGLGTDEKAIYKYLEGKKPEEIEKIKKAYQEKTGRVLAVDIEDDFSDAQKDQADALLAGDKAAAAAARIQEATDGLGTDEEGIYDQIKGKSKQEREAIIKAYEEKHGKGSFDAMLADELSDDYRKLAQQYKDKGELDPGFALNLAMSSLGTDEDLIKETLKGKSKDEIKAIKEAYTEKTGKNLDTELESELDGRDAFEVGQILKGKPQGSKEYYDRAMERYEFERGEGSTWFSRGVMDASEAIGMHSKSEMLENQTQRLKGMFDENGNLKPDFTEKDVERIASYQETDATNYKDAKESVGKAVTTAGTIAVAALATICTKGAAAPWLVAVISGTLAGGANMALRYGMQGDAYGGEDIAIDAVVATLASALGGFLADKAQFMTKLDDILKSLGEGAAKKAAQEALRGTVSPDVLKEIFNDAQWRKGVEYYFLNVVAVAGVSAIKGAASGGMEDPLKSKSSILFGAASGVSGGIIDEGVSGIKGEYKGRIEDLLGRLAVAGVSKAAEEQAKTSASDFKLRLIAKQAISAIALNDMSTANQIIDKNTVDFSAEEKQRLVGIILEEALNNPDMSASKTADQLNNPQEVIVSEEQSQKAATTEPEKIPENTPIPKAENSTGKTAGNQKKDDENNLPLNIDEGKQGNHIEDNFTDIPKVKGEQVKLATGAKRGLDPTPETIREGSVRMEEHPEYANTLAKIKELGFDLKSSQDDPHVEVKEVLNSQKEVVRVLKVVYVQEGMRYLDLEHELGHIRQLTERFGDKCLPTERVIEYPDGRVKDISENGGTLTNWQNTVTEYHNRLDEFLRLNERGANIELLREHAQGIREWRELYQDKGLKRGKSPSRKSWVEEHFPDLYELEKRYSSASGYKLE